MKTTFRVEKKLLIHRRLISMKWNDLRRSCSINRKGKKLKIQIILGPILFNNEINLFENRIKNLQSR